MKKSNLMAVVLAVAAGPAFADGHAATGDAAAGEKAFARQCATCHVVVNEAGETLAGRRSRTGPNLYRIDGATIGAVEDFRYGNGLEALRDAGAVWTEEAFVGWVMNPTPWVREATGDSKVRSKMTFKIRDEDDAKNIYAYIASLGGDS